MSRHGGVRALAAMWIGGLLVLAPGAPGAAKEEPPPPAPENLTLAALKEAGHDLVLPDGTIAPLAGLLAENRTVVIEFWATWCAPCRKVVPDLSRLQKKHGDKALIVLGLTVEEPADAMEKVREFARGTKAGYTLAFAPRALYRQMTGTDEVSVPRSFVFAPDGSLVMRERGYSSSLHRRIGSAVQQALQPRAPGP